MITLFRLTNKDTKEALVEAQGEVVQKGTTEDSSGDRVLRRMFPFASAIESLATGRSLFQALISHMKLSAQDVVLMPAYIAEGVISPFLRSGIQVMHYRLNSDLSPNESDLIDILNRNSVRLVVLVRYFGFPYDFTRLVQNLSKRGVPSLIDGAHALFDVMNEALSQDMRPDYILVSLNKFLPTTDGAVLLRLHAQELAYSHKSLKPSPFKGDSCLSDEAIRAYEAHLQINRKLFETTDPILARDYLVASGEAYDRYYRFIQDDLSPHMVSPQTFNLLSRLNFDMMAQARKANLAFLYQHLQSPGWWVYAMPPSSKEFAPFALPLVLQGVQRDVVIRRAFENGIVLSHLVNRWDFLSRESREETELFSSERLFLESHVLVPVSEFLSRSDLIKLVSFFNSTLREILL